jgi:hypothetical protein
MEYAIIHIFGFEIYHKWLFHIFQQVMRNYQFDFRKLLQPALKLLLQKDMLIIRGIKQVGALPQTPLHFLFPIKNRDVPLNTKNEAKKVKTSPASLKKLAFERLNRPNSPQMFRFLKPICRLKQGRFLTPFSLIFWLTGRGHSLASLLRLSD